MKKNFFILMLFFAACVHHPEDRKFLEKELMMTDQDFSLMSIEKGRNIAFLNYAADSVIMLRQGKLPLFGKAELTRELNSAGDKDFQLRWAPVMAEASGNIGYTFGKWELRFKGKDTVQYGTYVTVWKRFPDGKWRFVLDGGNDTPKPN